MKIINFYQRASGLHEQEILGKLLRVSLQKGLRSVVLVSNTEQMVALSQYLWKNALWMPHGLEGEDHITDPHPIWITRSLKSGNLDYGCLFVLCPAQIHDFFHFERIYYLFSHNEVSMSRAYWKVLKNKEYQLTYWLQDVQGGWEKKN